jgi:hypothetical protein
MKEAFWGASQRQSRWDPVFSVCISRGSIVSVLSERTTAGEAMMTLASGLLPRASLSLLKPSSINFDNRGKRKQLMFLKW